MALAARRTRIRSARFPYSVELSYRAILRRLIADIKAIILAEIEAHGRELVFAADTYRMDDEASATGWAALLRDLLERIGVHIGRRLIAALESVASIGEAVSTTNRTEWRRQVRAAYGVDILRGEPWLRDLLSGWELENLALIRSLPDRLVDQLRGEMSRALTSGTSLRQLTQIVRERTGAAESRAELIARDQIGKLNGQLAQRRQTDIGVEQYVWRTSQDERVRPTHRVRDGKTYRWDAGGIIPGSEIRCRCVADPLFPDELEAAVVRRSSVPAIGRR
jgi:SPP1 gp7 family putative phage head morphogenesis protein